MSSDSSDEENLDLLKEAQDLQFINDSMFSEKHEKSNRNSVVEAKKDKLPSLRVLNDEGDQFNFLKVTPEFQNTLPRNYQKFLDADLNQRLTDKKIVKRDGKETAKGGIKLFANSKHFIRPLERLNKTNTEVVNNVNLKKVPRYNKLKVKVPEEALREVAVSPGDILSKKGVNSWSTRTKAPVFKYKSDQKRQISG
ncbi:hypothetical protein NQ317_002126 [Molorchus minor]|uniref:Protein CUSTOS n=1 Tax=Molorchus minor TaxID=1323400 RepID=A0ABQ9JX75_9CUCU|nr:hypothetical protein NQ317_002126 [Molorchus minor]